MLNIENQQKFTVTIADALTKVQLTVKDPQTKKRWINTITKAVIEIETNGDFMIRPRRKSFNHLVAKIRQSLFGEQRVPV